MDVKWVEEKEDLIDDDVYSGWSIVGEDTATRMSIDSSGSVFIEQPNYVLPEELGELIRICPEQLEHLRDVVERAIKQRDNERS